MGEARDGIIVRPAAAGDLESVAGLWEELLALHHRLDDRFWKRAEDGREKYRQWMQEAIDAEERTVVVAERSGEIVGFAHATLKDGPPVVVPRRGGFVTDLFVSEDCRRVGVGRRLLAGVEEWFKGHGVEEITLSTAVCNDAAAAFWRAMGFEPWTYTMWKPTGAPD